MQFASTQHRTFRQQQRGFSLVELITVIIVLGTVAIVAAPRFSSTDTFAEYALQQRLQTAMRTIQIQSMYDTRPNYCYKINFVSGNASAFGPPTQNFQAGNETQSCATIIDYSVPRYLRTDANELSAQGINLEALDSGLNITQITFNSLGQPFTSAGSCAGGCEFTFSGGDSAKLCVSSEGYVHAC
ncbi:type II secretion system protein [Glaciecola sp. SC05]|uniref:type II secretion system protein n=1 Tax=Glaciecola sp. SC05 TaxID=1987355 RepID=UPI00352778C8